MKHPLALLLLLSLPAASPALAPSKTASSTVFTPARLKQSVDRFAAKVLADKTSAGLAVGVAENGIVRLIRGYGRADVENRVPVHEATVFRIGSVTKEFTAAAVMLLVERGKLSLDDPLSKFFPDFRRGGEVTVRHLLSHTSGIRNYTADGFFREAARQDRTLSELAGFVSRREPLYDFDPGTKWSYSNSGYVLLGAIVERASGQPFDLFLKSNIFDPLDLRHTRLDDLAEIVPHRASGYDKSAEAPSGFANAGFLSMSAATAAGAMRSTASDLLKWHSALLGGKLLKPETVAMMAEPARLKDGRAVSLGWAETRSSTPPFDYGLGFIVDRQKGHRIIGHGGSIHGFNAWLYTFPDQQVTAVLLTNTGGASYASAPQLIEALFGDRSGNSERPPVR